jgi:hypothetical protein
MQEATTAATHSANKLYSKADQSRVLNYFISSVIAMSAMSHMMSADESQERCENSVLLSIMLKCNSKRAENNKLFMKTADAD